MVGSCLIVILGGEVVKRIGVPIQIGNALISQEFNAVPGTSASSRKRFLKSVLT